VALAMAPHLERWYLGGIEGPRGQSAAELAARVHAAVPRATTSEYPTVAAAYAAARAQARSGDRVVIFGSFQTVSAVLKDF